MEIEVLTSTGPPCTEAANGRGHDTTLRIEARHPQVPWSGATGTSNVPGIPAMRSGVQTNEVSGERL
jgi:hypothetical protein